MVHALLNHPRKEQYSYMYVIEVALATLSTHTSIFVVYKLAFIIF